MSPAARLLAKRKPDDDLWAHNRCIDVRVAPALADGALRIMHTLVTAPEARGIPVR